MALSSGQRQRLAIARALLRDPAILVFDEATSNLDPETEQRLLQSFRSGRRRTTIFITHRLTTARHTDKIFVFQGGRINQIGRHEELLSKKGRYHYMWTAFAGGKDEHFVSGESQF
jgi:ABC-type multidrug transport system fused ATPase/permease subunit